MKLTRHLKKQSFKPPPFKFHPPSINKRQLNQLKRNFKKGFSPPLLYTHTQLKKYFPQFRQYSSKLFLRFCHHFKPLTSLIKQNPKQSLIYSGTAILSVFLIFISYKIVTTPRPPKIKMASENSSYLYSATNKTFSVDIGSKENNTPQVKFSLNENSSLTFSPASGATQLKQPTTENKIITFKNIYPYADITYQTLPNGIKEEIVINYPNGIHQYPFFLELNNIHPQYVTENISGTTFYDGNHKYLFHFQKPFAYDAKGNQTDQVTLQLKKDKNTQKMVAIITLDQEWLENSQRQYPITIDPTIVHDESSEFSPGQFNKTVDTGSGASPNLQIDTSGAQAYEDDTNTVALWHLDETSSNTCSGGEDYCDSSSNNYHLSENSTPTSTTGYFDNARNFDGGDDRGADSFDGGILKQSASSGQFTMEAWVKPDGTPSANERMIVGRYGCHSGIAAFANQSFYFQIATDDCWTGGIFLSSGVISDWTDWHHVAATFNSGFIKIYVDGELKNSNDWGGTIRNHSNDFYIGGIETYTFDGIIDEIRLSNIERSADEIANQSTQKPYSIYTSDVIDLVELTGLDSISWTESGVATGDGETLYSETDLLAHWKFNETSGTTADNAAGSCGTSCDGTLSGFDSTSSQDADPDSGWTTNNRRWGAGALMFDGSNDYIDITNSTDFDVQRLTIEAWVYSSNFDQNMFIFEKGPVNTQYACFFEGTDLTFRSSNSSDANDDLKTDSSDAGVQPNTWNHVACVYNGSYKKIYVNGQEAASKSYTETLKTGQSGQRIGAFVSATPSYFFNGHIDSTRIYSRALSASEILSNYQAGDIEIQTRTSADNSTWEAWKPTTNETQIESFDSNEDNTSIFNWSISSFNNILGWRKSNNTIPSASDTTGTDGRIPLGTSGKGDDSRAYAPAIIKDGNTYKMWYSGQDGSNTRIYYATSSDGLTWTKYNNTIPSASDTTGTDGRIPLGTSGKGDSDHAVNPSVIKDGSTYKMWYDGYDGSNYRIYYATSSDGLTWTKYNNSTPSNSDTTSTDGRIPLGTSGKGDDAGTYYASVIKDGNTYKMWYSGKDDPNINIYYATSSDGLTWTKYNNTIPSASDTTGTDGRIPLGTSGKGDDYYSYSSSLIKDGNTYKMWYAGYEGAYVRIYYATSSDGLTWTKYNNSTPSNSDTTSTDGRIPLGTSGKGDDFHAYFPEIIKDNNRYRMWYSGYDGANIIIYHAEIPTFSIAQTTDSIISLEGSASQKISLGQPQIDAHTVLLYHFDETNGDLAGDDIFDATSNNNDGEINGTGLATAIISGVSGKAREFNGTSDYLRLPSSSLISGQEITISFWAYGGSTLGGVYTSVFEATDTSTNRSVNIHFPWSNSIIYWDCGNGAGYNRISKLATKSEYMGKWNHWAFTKNATTGSMKIYLNGALWHSGTGNTASIDIEGVTNIGASRNNDNYWPGKLDEFKIEDIERNAEEIAEEYRMGRDHYLSRTITSTNLSSSNKLPFYIAADKMGAYLETTAGESSYTNYQPDTNTVGLWHLDEDTNDACNAGSDDVCDSSGNGNHGDESGSPPIVTGKIGKARDFDGTDDFLEISDNNNLDIGTNDLTVEAWIKTSNTGAILYKGVVNTSGYGLSIENTDIIYFRTITVHHGWDSNGAAIDNNWHHVVGVEDGDIFRIYFDGVERSSQDTGTQGDKSSTNNLLIGAWDDTPSAVFNGTIDEVRISNIARTAAEIRDSYERGARTHSITIDFTASLDSGNLISDSSDLSFTVDATTDGLSQKGSMLFEEDKIIVRENYAGTEYIAQGDVTSVNASTGAVTVDAWDTGSTFPSSGYTTNTTVFKWQREYWPITNPLDEYLNTITNLSIRVTDGDESRTIWLDDLRSSTSYLTNPTSSIPTSTAQRYFQYRAIFSTTDTAVTPSLTSLTLDYTNNQPPVTPTLSSSYLHDKVKTVDTTPEIRFSGTDPESDDLVYQIEYYTDSDFSAATSKTSDTDPGFTNITTPADTSPFTQGETIAYTFQSALSNDTTYFYRVKAKDPSGTNTYSSWSDIRSFTIDTALTGGTAWFETHADQFSTDTRTGNALINESGHYVEVEESIQIDNADTATDWISSNSTNTTVTQETTIKQEGTGSVKITTTAENNTTLDLMEYANDTAAQTAYVHEATTTTGGTITNIEDYHIHTFTSSGTFTPSIAMNVEVLVVAGGGGGGNDVGGGGGAGGLTYNSSFAISTGATTVTVGSGGAAYTNGGNSVFSTITSTGGGRGGNYNAGSGATGGSGGGGAGIGGSGGAGTSGQGSSGGNGWSSTYSGGGGGGAGGAGATGSANGGVGGIGLQYSISGTSTYYAGGGGAGGSSSSAAGGLGGGGLGTVRGSPGDPGGAGTPNTGGGGGGPGGWPGGGAGGSGIVIARYLKPAQSYSESSIKTQGNYALKSIARTTSLNKTLTRTISPTIDLSNLGNIDFSIQSNRTGSNIKIGIHDSGGTTTEITPNITSANTFQSISWDISGVSNTNKDAIDKIIITIVNADTENTFYLDNMVANEHSVNETVTLTKSTLDLSDASSLEFYIRSDKTGQFMRFQMGESASTEQTYDVTINSANTWEQKTWDISSINSTDKDALTKYAFQIIADTSDAILYFDDIYAAGASTSDITSTSITAANINSSASVWGHLAFTDDETNGDIKYYIYYDNSGTPTIIPDSVLPGNSTGFDTGSADLTDLSTTTYPILYLKAAFTYSGGSPQLQDWTLSFNQKPNVPTLDSPTDTVTGQSLTPILKTTATDPDTDYVHYKIQICENNAMTSNCQTFDQTTSQTGWSNQNTQSNTAYTSGTQGFYTLQSPLSADSTYYWRSYAIDPGGSNLWSDTQSSVYSFTTTQAPYGTDLLVEGTGNPSKVTDKNPDFSAICQDPDAGDIINKYRIQVDNNQDFSSPAWDSGALGTGMTNCTEGTRSQDFSYGGTALALDGTWYYWRIKFWDQGEAEGEWSTENSSFRMSFTPGAVSCRIQEANDESSLTLLWTDLSSSESQYRIEKNIDAAGFNFLYNTAADATSYQDTTVSSNHTYQYRVRAENGDTSEWCTTDTVDLSTGTFNFQGLNFQGLELK